MFLGTGILHARRPKKDSPHFRELRKAYVSIPDVKRGAMKQATEIVEKNTKHRWEHFGSPFTSFNDLY